MQTKILIVALLLSSIVFGQNKINEKLIDDKLIEIQKATQVVGFSVAIVQGNKVIYCKGFGFKDMSEKSKVDHHTLFPIGSTSKAFTTALLGILEEEKGLSFTDSPRKYLPELTFYNNHLNNNITIEDMVSHRTGLPRHDNSWYLFPTNDKDSLLARIRYHAPFTEIRQQWYYNNFMYLAQGLITEKLTGKSWEENIQERFFTPLQMTRSNLSIAELQQSTNISVGYKLVKNNLNASVPYFDIAAISPAGSINSSANDMVNWIKVWLNDGKYNGLQVVPQSYIRKAINPLMLVGTGIADEQFPDQHLNSYGYAWFTSSYKGHYRLEHGGNIDGFSANVSFFPTDDIGIVVLANQDGSALPALVRNAISDELLDLKRTDWVTYYKDKKEQQNKVQINQETVNSSKNTPKRKPSHLLSEYTGKYYHGGYGTIIVTIENDSLWANFVRKRVFLQHNNFDVFDPLSITDGKVTEENTIGFKFNFTANEIGEISGVKLKIEPTLEPLLFKRSPNEVILTTHELEPFCGNYKLASDQIVVSIKNNLLMLQVPQQSEYTLIPIKENEFLVKGLEGYKVVFYGDDLILHQPNGTYKATKN